MYTTRNSKPPNVFKKGDAERLNDETNNESKANKQHGKRKYSPRKRSYKRNAALLSPIILSKCSSFEESKNLSKPVTSAGDESIHKQNQSLKISDIARVELKDKVDSKVNIKISYEEKYPTSAPMLRKILKGKHNYKMPKRVRSSESEALSNTSPLSSCNAEIYKEESNYNRPVSEGKRLNVDNVANMKYETLSITTRSRNKVYDTIENSLDNRLEKGKLIEVTSNSVQQNIDTKCLPYIPKRRKCDNIRNIENSLKYPTEDIYDDKPHRTEYAVEKYPSLAPSKINICGNDFVCPKRTDCLNEPALYPIVDNKLKDKSVDRENNLLQLKSTEIVLLVIDTNILIDYITFLESIKGIRISNGLIKLVIPYVVLQELDNLKSRVSEGVKTKARNAVKFINSLLLNQDPYVMGQSFECHCGVASVLSGEGMDDAILGCCLEYRKKGENIALFSNDTNLRNKALVSDIKAFNLEQLEEEIREVGGQVRNRKQLKNIICLGPDESKESANRIHNFKSNSSFREAVESIHEPNNSGSKDHSEPNNSGSKDHSEPNSGSHTHSEPNNSGSQDHSATNFNEELVVSVLGRILTYAMKDAYGEPLWKEIIIYKPPWSALHILKCIQKHWIAVFLDKFPPEFNLVNKELINILSKLSPTSEDKCNFNEKLNILFKLIRKRPYSNFIKLSSKKPHSFLHITSTAPIHGKESPRVSHDEIMLYPDKSLEEASVDDVCMEGISESCAPYNVQAIQNSITSMGSHASAVVSDFVNRRNYCAVEHQLDIVNSIQHLNDVLLTFWNTFKSLVQFSSFGSNRPLREQLSYYWQMANRSPQNISYRDEDVLNMSATSDGKTFFTACIVELEKLMQTINSNLHV